MLINPPRRRVWRAVSVLVAALACLPLAACTPSRESMAGLSVTASGGIVAVLRVCSGHLDGVRLLRARPSSLETAGEWTSATPLSGTVTVPLDDPGSGWRVVSGSAALDPAATYDLEGWAADNSQLSEVVEFRPEQLRDLKPGMVRYLSGTADNGTTAVYDVVTLRDFEAQACVKLGK